MVTAQLEEELEQLRQSRADITGELEKSKKLLSIQQTISDQYKKEVCQNDNNNGCQHLSHVLGDND